eukprot:superscaffoldBa00000059_g981
MRAQIREKGEEASQKEQFEAASQSELLIGVVVMSALQLPGPQPKHTDWNQPCSHFLLICVLNCSRFFSKPAFCELSFSDPVSVCMAALQS